MYCLQREILLRSLKTALLVGTILALINHGQQFLSGQFAPAWIIPMLITYCVPFMVATYGQAQGKRSGDRTRAEVSAEARQWAVAAVNTVRMQTVSRQRERKPSAPVLAKDDSSSFPPLAVSATSNVLESESWHILCCTSFIPRCLKTIAFLVLPQVQKRF